MPYIRESRRWILDELLNGLKQDDPIESPGELNYIITSIILSYLDTHGRCYDTMNEVMGVLACSKQELYRRLIAEYEDEKVLENGDLPWEGPIE